MLINSLPLEVFIKILRNLSCSELTTAVCVCRLWNQVILYDQYLRTICFKTPTATFFEEGTEFGRLPDSRDTRVRFHPAMGCISYRMGDPLSTVHISKHDVRGYRAPLIHLPLQNDFATIPVTKVMEIEILPEGAESPRLIGGVFRLTVSVSNPTGIRLKDIFSSIALKSMESCDLVAYASGDRVSNKWMPPSLSFHKKAEILGKHKSYAGLKSAIVKDAIVEVKLRTVI